MLCRWRWRSSAGSASRPNEARRVRRRGRGSPSAWWPPPVEGAIATPRRTAGVNVRTAAQGPPWGDESVLTSAAVGRRPLLDDDQAAEVVDRYIAGETIDELAAAFGCSIT